MGIEEGPKRGSQAGRPCRLAAGLRLVAAPSSPGWRRAPPPLPRRTVLTQACPSLACPGRQVAERGALSALGLAFVPAPWGNCGLARPRQEWSVSGPSPQALSSDCCEGSSKAPAGSGRNGPGGLGWEAWSSPKRCWGRRQSRFFQPPPLPRLEMTESPPPQFVWSLLERRGHRGWQEQVDWPWHVSITHMSCSELSLGSRLLLTSAEVRFGGWGPCSPGNPPQG